MLLEESVWKIEDRLNVLMETLADQEADLIRVKRLTSLLSERVSKLEGRTQPCNGSTLSSHREQD